MRLSVTLHVSVWVEINILTLQNSIGNVTLHVSVWVEIFISPRRTHSASSRSTWACELKFLYQCRVIYVFLSRSTWACELKWKRCWYGQADFGVTLHVSVWVEIVYLVNTFFIILSRSTWACELKFPVWPLLSEYSSHAPRERVSWNVCWPKNCLICTVTLHVSVWVEM